MKPAKIDDMYTKLKTAIDNSMIKLEKELEQQREEERRLAEEAERERKRQEKLARIRLEEARNATDIPNASKWNYSQLYAGFYSDDPNRKQASLTEIRKRLEVYRKWKAENDTE
ncbi:uncharacterized protein LOC123275004 [Cotesia glomerata]|uniref:uncharacterized protein LOC123275004 n=1 Tax=Cotesia glomerata TaxID=32391 RepID=UPI001D010C47|nr:uncharacterized protein LOC123275004 [Cotesia glomerata]